jgi:probable rRNA maturation factor
VGMMIDFENNTDIDVNFNIFEPLLEFLTSKDVELIIVGDDEIKAINAQTRGKDSATDVLSFPLEEVPNATLLGTIIISIDHVKAGSAQFGHTQEDELSLLFTHGLLHLLGYDHECDDGEMREKEEEVINKFNLPKSLIIRTEES